MAYELYNNNCLEILPTLKENSIDLVVTDPPYGISNGKVDICFNGARADIRQNFGEWDVFPDEAAFGAFTAEWLRAVYRILKPHKMLCFFFSLKKLGLAEKLIKETGFILKDYFFKICSNPIPNFRKVGYQSAVEPVLICQKANTSHKKPASTSFRKNLPAHPNYIKVPVVGGEQRTIHPTQKHTASIAPLIKYWTVTGDVVLDPFSGSGTTGVVAHELGRRYIGIEKNEEYYKIVEKRYS